MSTDILTFSVVHVQNEKTVCSLELEWVKNFVKNFIN